MNYINKNTRSSQVPTQEAPEKGLTTITTQIS